jgi:ABC-type transport system involved in multi-copper enzyme maturation permease subunit
MQIVRTEFLKLRTTRLWWGLTLGLLGLSALGAILTLVFADQEVGFSLSEEAAQRSLFGSAGFSSIFALVFGIIGMAGEYKQGTITPTFLASPRRWHVVLAKAVAYGLAGFLLGVVSTALVAAISYVGLAIKDIDVIMPASEVFALLGGGTATATFYGVLGVAIGAVIPNQIAALIAALVEQLIAEPLLFNFFPEQGRFLVGGASSILSGAPNVGATLSLWAAAGVLGAWCVALLTMGSVVTESKDIT